MADDRQVISGSDRKADAAFVANARSGATMEVTVFLREQQPGALDATLAAQQDGAEDHLSVAEFASAHGIRGSDSARLRAFADSNGLRIGDQYAGGRVIKLAGTEQQLATAFGVRLGVTTATGPNGVRSTYRSVAGPVSVPQELSGAITGVIGFDQRPVARPRIADVLPVADDRAAGAPEGRTSYNPQTVAQLYNYPQIDGTGVTIGIIELGGTVSDADLTAYFAGLGLPKPELVHVSVDGQVAQPDPTGADVEVALDVEVIGAMAPGCKIVIYDAPNTEQGFIDAILAAAHDQTNSPSVVSISWGAPESGWSASGMRGMDAAFAIGTAMGVTYTAASGDGGSTDGVADGRQHADHPSSSPHVLACGGTALLGRRGKITSEFAWGGAQDAHGAGGGGVSEQFHTPAYQRDAGVDPVSANPRHSRGRGTPDVAGNADPVTGYRVRSNGQDIVVGGTSAAAPQWAALLGLATKAIGRRLGAVHKLLYDAPPNSFNEVIYGDNGAYQAGGRWSPATGLGSPNGSNLVSNLARTVPQMNLVGRRQPAADNRRVTPVRSGVE